MSEFHEGRVAATFQVGARIEDTKDAYEKEVVTIEGAKGGLLAAIKALEDYRSQVQEMGVAGRVPIRETDIGLKYVVGCQELLQKLLRDVEIKRCSAIGAVDALKRVVADTKKLWDEEHAKLKQILEFESATPKDMKERPVGYMPKEHPLEEMRKDLPDVPGEETVTPELPVPKKKGRKRSDEGKPSRAQ